MPRARNIKPGFYKNEQLAECSVWARFIFPGLWMLADREGRLEDRPKRIKAELLPFDSAEVDPLLQELHAAGLIHRYQHGQDRYIQVVKFLEHQYPHQKEPPSTIPKPESCTRQAPVKNGVETGAARLNPESPILNPEKGTVGLPPDVRALRQQAVSILAFLNEKTGRNYEPVPANVDLIVARLKEATAGDVRAVVAKKCREWSSDPKMNEFLRPKTLFNRTNFAQYKGELVAS